MRDFPLFTTENGVGSLVLKEIPYSGIAYVTIRDSSFPTVFLDECVDFCKAVGAQKIYASGSDVLKAYPLFTSVLQMRASSDTIIKSDASLFPVTEKTAGRWREIYNSKMKNVDNASYMSEAAMADVLKRGCGYFIHKGGVLLGIGMAADGRIECVASVTPGGGREVVSVLTHALMGESVLLEVASTNRKAICLYENMGFTKTAVVSHWYKIFDLSRKST